MKRQEGIGGNRCVKRRAKYWHTITRFPAFFKVAGEAPDEITRKHLAFATAPVTGLHRVLDQYADFNDLIAAGTRWDGNEGACHSDFRLRFDACGERDQHLDGMRPAGTIAHFRDGDKLLRGGETYACGNVRAACKRSKRE